MVKDVTNSAKDVHDFWYNSDPIHPSGWYNSKVNKEDNSYNQLVDYQVSKMKTNERKSFDELYEEFKSKSIDDQVNNLKELGRKLVSQIDGIVDKLDVILEEDNYPDNGILEDGQLPEESYNNEFEITVDPLTHKVIYNTELNEYKVVRR